MGFLKRFFSIGRKKNRRKHAPFDFEPKHGPSQLGIIEEDDQEAVASRLLRSASSRFAVVHEADYASLPPLPHPINNVLLTPAASADSLASTFHRGTYTVTVHGRTQHSKTSFPLPDDDEAANPEPRLHQGYHPVLLAPRYPPVTPRDQKRLLGLRSDPSVASLLDMYDEHGCLDSKVFSNSPPSPERHGRVQTKRTGSTLRQLLGGPSSLSSRQSQDVRHNSVVEGDISWAERLLDERLSTGSSTSSLGVLHTPTDTRFPHDPSIHDPNNDNASQHSFNSTGNYPSISSMEVELSNADSTATSHCNPHGHPYPYAKPEPKTPQRASEVFEFLTDKKRPRRDRSPPVLPLSSDSSCHDNDNPLRHSRIPISHDTRLYRSHSLRPPLSDGEKFEHAGSLVSRAKSYNALIREGPRGHQPNTLVTAPSILRGPRPLPTPSHLPKSVLNHTYGDETVCHPAFIKRLDSERVSHQDEDRFTRIPARSHRKASSTHSLACTPTRGDDGVYPCAVKYEEDDAGKENEKCDPRFLAAHHFLPKTPIRTHSHAHSRAAFFSPASPASSTELSPVAKQMMTNLREKRMRARAAERTRAKLTGRFVSLKP